MLVIVSGYFQRQLLYRAFGAVSTRYIVSAPVAAAPHPPRPATDVPAIPAAGSNRARTARGAGAPAHLRDWPVAASAGVVDQCINTTKVRQCQPRQPVDLVDAA